MLTSRRALLCLRVLTGLLPPSSGAAPVDVPGPSGIARPAAAPVDPRSVAPDPTLPLPSSRPPVNWHPDPPLLAWASKSLEDVEWTEDNRKAIHVELSCHLTLFMTIYLLLFLCLIVLLQLLKTRSP